MALAGYPDWERVIRSGGDPVAVSRVAITATTNLGPFSVQQWQSVMMWSLTPAASDVYQINWLWYDSAALTNLLSSIFQVINDNQEFPITVPVGGPWLVLQIVPKVGGNAQVPVFTWFGMSTDASTFRMNTYSGPLFSDTSNMGANQLTTWTLANQHYGNAVFHFGPDTGVMAYVRVQYYNWGAGAFNELCRWPDIANTKHLNETISLPAGPIIVDYKNGAAAQFITGSLMPQI